MLVFTLFNLIDETEVLQTKPSPDFKKFLQYLYDHKFIFTLDFTGFSANGTYIPYEKKISLNIHLGLHAWSLSSKQKSISLYKLLKHSFVDFNPTLPHELQHAYDDWRSKGMAIMRSPYETVKKKKFRALAVLSDSEELDKLIMTLHLEDPAEIWVSHSY